MRRRRISIDTVFVLWDGNIHAAPNNNAGSEYCWIATCFVDPFKATPTIVPGLGFRTVASLMQAFI